MGRPCAGAPVACDGEADDRPGVVRTTLQFLRVPAGGSVRMHAPVIAQLIELCILVYVCLWVQVWISRSSTGRSAQWPWGANFPKVVRANRIAVRVSNLMRCCEHLQVPYVVEQPLSSMLWMLEPVDRAIKRTGALACMPSDSS